jgi:hypothetical protein
VVFVPLRLLLRLPLLLLPPPVRRVRRRRPPVRSRAFVLLLQLLRLLLRLSLLLPQPVHSLPHRPLTHPAHDPQLYLVPQLWPLQGQPGRLAQA